MQNKQAAWSLGLDTESLDRVLAAVEHARVLMLRGERPVEVGKEMQRLARVENNAIALERMYATAIELLALAPPDRLAEWIDRAADARRRPA